MKNWKQLKSQEVFSNKYFRMRVDECELFDGRVMPKYFVVDFPDWVQIVAIDEKGLLVCVEQYRYPGQDWFLEFPGGSTHGHSNEDHKEAAARELLEETGHTSIEWTYIGAHHPNPALLSNRCHVYVARNCREVAGLKLDPFEVLRVKKMSFHDFEKAIHASKVRHSLMLATLELVRPIIG